MAKEFTVTLPKLGESIVSATVVQWLKKEGDFIGKDEALLEVATDKVNSEIPSPVKGRVKKILVSLDQTVNVDEPLVIIETDVDFSLEEKKENIEVITPSQQAECSNFYSPAVMRLAEENGLSLDELAKIPRSSSRLSKKDIEDYVKTKQAKPEDSSEERIKMSSMRRLIADNMTRSFYEAPHASVITEVDVTAILEFIKDNKERFQEKYGAKLSITSFFARAMAKAIKDYPLINASLDDDTIVVKHFVNLGIAVHVEGGLQVPVIKNCQQLSLVELAKSIATIADKARHKKLQPDDVLNGTITLTNFGMTGAMIGIPIIRYPEVAIIGAGTIQKKVIPQDDSTLAIRSVVALSLTFDHRVLDGIYGCNFLNRIKEVLEEKPLLE